MVFETGLSALFFLVGRILFGAVLAYMGLGHFLGADQMAGYAEMKGVPAPRASVLLSGGTLAFGGILIVLGAYPLLAGGAVATFMLLVTPKMHDFWAIEDPEQRQSDLINFQKNVVIFGAALVFMTLASEAWPYAVDLRL